MKDETPAWSAVAIVFSGNSVLAISRNFNTRDPAFPGGDSIPTDESPAQTARRELLEETGLKAVELRCMHQWVGERGQDVYAFFVPRWEGSRLRTSNEGKPYWAQPRHLVVPLATFREEAQLLLEKLGRVKAA